MPENQESTEKLYRDLSDFSQKRGYFLNPNTDFTKALVKSLLVNEKRYGYQACPCRLATGHKTNDLDIICPCDYRDADVVDYGGCYCGLYVSQEVSQGKRVFKPIPERRKTKEERDKMNEEDKKSSGPHGKLPIWRCQVCGYLCAREDAPDVCPICGVAHDRFERYM
jgi:ferredoxin-thioredoxin reductase catalytic chain